jgi:hypothetical protein
MGRAKEIIVKVIPAKIANEFVKKHHYSGKVVANSKLHFGCFLDDKLHGVLQYGSSLDKSKTIGLVENTLWNEFLELNRMAFDEYLPKFSESRCIAISIKLIKKNAPHIKWILSYSDGGQCGDGTIYRASGFVLTALNKCSIFQNEKGEKYQQASISARGSLANKEALNIQYQNKGKFGLVEGFCKAKGLKRIEGYSLRYIYIIDKTCKITVPILPFSEIDKQGAGMYKGKKITLQKRKVITESDEVVTNPAFNLE